MFSGLFGISHVHAQTVLNSIDQLVDAMGRNNGNYRMAAGTYRATEMHFLDFSRQPLYAAYLLTGNNNTFDMRGANFELPVTVMSSTGERDPIHMLVWGNNNTIIGGSWSTVLANSAYNVNNNRVLNIDFVAYNEDTRNRPGRGGAVEIRIMGDNTEMIDNTITTRGSFPFGYGEIYGKGNQNVFGLNKHSSVLVNGDNTLIDGMDLNVQTFGHGIFMQAADNTTIRNSSVEGVMRLGQEFYEDGSDSIPAQYNFEQFYELWRAGPIDREKAFPLSEDGIRMYPTGVKKDGEDHRSGSLYVYDTEVIGMRSGAAVYDASECHLENVTLLGNSAGFNICGSGDVVNGRADAAYGPVVQAQRSRGGDRTFDIEIIDAPHASGDHPLTEIAGSDHTYNFTSNVQNPVNVRPIVVGLSWDRWDANDAENRANGQVLNNNTSYPITFTSEATGTTGFTYGSLSGNTSNNNVERRTGGSTPASRVVQITKRSGDGFSIDGKNGGANGQNVHLWTENRNNVNQQWIEFDRGNGYFSYQKQGTNYCLDGGNGGDNGQNVYLWNCSSNNQNQHWQKVSTGSGFYKLIKRNASGFAINGGSRGANGQNVDLYRSSSNSHNLQWSID